MLTTPNDTRSRPGRRTGQRLLLGGATTGLTAFVVTFLVEGALRPGYRPWRHAISQLSLGPYGWVNITGVLVAAASLLAFATGLHAALPTGVGSRWGPRLVAVTGTGLGLTAVLLDDPGLGYPPGTPAQQSLHGLLHGLLITLAVGCLSAACLVMARRFAGDPGWRGWARYSTTTGLVVAAGYVATAVLTGLDQAGVLANAPGGLLQRIMIIAGFGWCAVLAGRLLVDTRLRPDQGVVRSHMSPRWAVAGVVEAPADQGSPTSAPSARPAAGS
jgi:Protein of unknown function (DUF998)